MKNKKIIIMLIGIFGLAIIFIICKQSYENKKIINDAEKNGYVVDIANCFTCIN